jgi:hypothetical protein
LKGLESMDQYFGKTPIDTAKKCFTENRDLFGDSVTQPEKFNLYNGLRSLAEAVEQIQQELKTIRQELQQIRLQS